MSAEGGQRTASGRALDTQATCSPFEVKSFHQEHLHHTTCNTPDWLMGLPGMLLLSLSPAFLALPICDPAFTGVACRLNGVGRPDAWASRAELPLADALAAPGSVTAMWLTEPGRSTATALAGKGMETGSGMDGQVTCMTPAQQKDRCQGLISTHSHPP